jgi:hypothetical protein
MLKVSLEKDFQHLFEHQPSQPHVYEQQCRPSFLQVPEEVKEICEWLEES